MIEFFCKTKCYEPPGKFSSVDSKHNPAVQTAMVYKVANQNNTGGLRNKKGISVDQEQS